MIEPEKHSWGRLFLLRDDIVSQTLAEGNHWNPHVYHALEPYLGGWVIDAGANVGPLTLRFAEKAKGVLAYEPNPEMVLCLLRNINKLRLGNVQARARGLYSYWTNLAPVIRTDSPSSWPWIPTSDDVSIAGPLDALSSMEITAIKVDVQGADLHALQGCEHAIVRDRPALVFEFEENLARLHGHSWRDYEARLTVWGYDWKQIGDSNDFLALPK